MIKKILLLLLLITIITQSTFAQEKDGFDINRMFAGGTLVLGLGFGNNSQFTVGGNPEIGYSIFKNIDLGLCFNYIYSGISSQYYGNTEKINITQSGMGVFGRIHISDGFFIHLQPEFNTVHYKDFYKETGYVNVDTSLRSSSLLAGFGYGSRDVGNMNFFTLIMVDLSKDLYSPYNNRDGSIVPIIRGGVNFYFGRGKKEKNTDKKAP